MECIHRKSQRVRLLFMRVFHCNSTLLLPYSLQADRSKSSEAYLVANLAIMRFLSSPLAPCSWRQALTSQDAAPAQTHNKRLHKSGDPAMRCAAAHLEIVQGAQVEDSRIGHRRGVHLDHLPTSGRS